MVFEIFLQILRFILNNLINHSFLFPKEVAAIIEGKSSKMFIACFFAINRYSYTFFWHASHFNKLVIGKYSIIFFRQKNISDLFVIHLFEAASEAFEDWIIFILLVRYDVVVIENVRFAVGTFER